MGVGAAVILFELEYNTMAQLRMEWRRRSKVSAGRVSKAKLLAMILDRDAFLDYAQGIGKQVLDYVLSIGGRWVDERHHGEGLCVLLDGMGLLTIRVWGGIIYPRFAEGNRAANRIGLEPELFTVRGYIDRSRGDWFPPGPTQAGWTDFEAWTRVLDAIRTIPRQNP